MAFNIDSNNLIMENEGVDVEYEGSTFKIASINNMKYQRLLSKLRYPYRHKLDKGTVDPETLLNIMCKALSKTILLDWSNVINSKGEIVDYSENNAVEALKNSAFRDFVISIAAEIENYKVEFIDDSVK